MNPQGTQGLEGGLAADLGVPDQRAEPGPVDQLAGMAVGDAAINQHSVATDGDEKVCRWESWIPPRLPDAVARAEVAAEPLEADMTSASSHWLAFIMMAEQ